MCSQLAAHLSVGVGDVVKRSLATTHDERQSIMLCIEDDALQRQLLQQAMKPLLAILAQQMDKRCIQRVLQGLVGRHRAPILAAVVLRREARKAHRDVGQNHLRQQGTFIQHGGKKKRLQYAARRTLSLHHIDHSRIGCVAVIAHINHDFIIQIINNINCSIVNIVHHIGLVMAVHEVHH